MRLAAAPISWGVSEVPGWGYQIPPGRVLAEMREVGFRATELGPPGYLPQEPAALRRLLEVHELQPVAAFVAPVLHKPALAGESLRQIEVAAAALYASGGELLVLAAAAASNYDRHQTPDRPEWSALVTALERARAIVEDRGLQLAFHAHVGTVVETAAEVSCLLELTDVDICLDTGHLLIGGADPVHVIEAAGGRVTHVHLKDVDGELADLVKSGELAFSDAVRRGLFRPLGAGVVDVPATLSHLQAAGYGGWYVLEQDAMLPAEPEPGTGPVEDVRRSVRYFESLVALNKQQGEERWQIS